MLFESLSEQDDVVHVGEASVPLQGSQHQRHQSQEFAAAVPHTERHQRELKVAVRCGECCNGSQPPVYDDIPHTGPAWRSTWHRQVHHECCRHGATGRHLYAVQHSETRSQ